VVLGDVYVVDALREGGHVVVLVDQVHDHGRVRAQPFSGRTVIFK
jgi:hypothetical protein